MTKKPTYLNAHQAAKIVAAKYAGQAEPYGLSHSDLRRAAADHAVIAQHIDAITAAMATDPETGKVPFDRRISGYRPIPIPPEYADTPGWRHIAAENHWKAAADPMRVTYIIDDHHLAWLVFSRAFAAVIGRDPQWSWPDQARAKARAKSLAMARYERRRDSEGPAPRSLRERVRAAGQKYAIAHDYGTSRPGRDEYDPAASRAAAIEACEWHTSTQYQAYAQLVEARTVRWPSGRTTKRAYVIAEYEIATRRWLTPPEAAGFVARRAY